MAMGQAHTRRTSHRAVSARSSRQEHGVSPRALYAFAFASGAAALAYEVSWMRLLSLTFGSSTLAVSAAVAGFRGGMGIGAWLYHRVEKWVAAPLRLYSLLEVGIAVTAFGLTALLWLLPPHFAALEVANEGEKNYHRGSADL